MPLNDPNALRSISRREFHRGVAAAAAGLAAGALIEGRAVAADRKEGKSPAQNRPAGKYVDIHVHLQQHWYEYGGALTADMILEWMDQHEVAQAVVLPLVSPEGWRYPLTTDWVLEATKPHRDRLIPFCDIDPRCPFLENEKAFRNALARYVDAGAKGLGEHKCAGPIDDPRRIELFRAAADLGLPILFHMDELRNTDRPGLPGLASVLKAIPNGVFFGHAPGFWAALADGALDRLMDQYPNLYGDLSANSGYRAISRNLDFGRQFILRRADRLCFATDYLQRDQKIPHFALYDKLDLPADVEAKVFRDNARRLLKLA